MYKEFNVPSNKTLVYLEEVLDVIFRFLSESVKDKECSQPVQSVEHLKFRITIPIRSVDTNSLLNVWKMSILELTALCTNKGSTLNK